MVARSSNGCAPPGSAAAMTSSTELVPMSIAATFFAAGKLLGQALEVEHLFHVRLHDELDAAVLHPTLVRVVGGHGTGLSEASRAPVRGRQARAALVLGSRQQHEHAARAHRGEAPIV